MGGKEERRVREEKEPELSPLRGQALGPEAFVLGSPESLPLSEDTAKAGGHPPETRAQRQYSKAPDGGGGPVCKK